MSFEMSSRLRALLDITNCSAICVKWLSTVCERPLNTSTVRFLSPSGSALSGDSRDLARWAKAKRCAFIRRILSSTILLKHASGQRGVSRNIRSSSLAGRDLASQCILPIRPLLCVSKMDCRDDLSRGMKGTTG